MRTSAAARRYARAMFSLARDDGRVSDVRNELKALEEALSESPDLRTALLTPLHPVEERKKVLGALVQQMGLSAVFGNFLSFLVDQRRLVAFSAIHEEYDRLADELSGRLTAEVRTATPLDDEQRERLRVALSGATGRDVELEVTLEPELIGGAIAKVGDLIFDGTLRAQLEQLRINLTKGS